MNPAVASALIVDDDPASCRLLEVHLRGLGLETRMASDGQQALMAVQQDMPAVMLLDLQMPRMGGMELLRVLRTEGAEFPIIVVTAHGSIEAAVAAMKEGAYDFLTKPFDPEHFALVVRKALERSHLIQANRLFREMLDARAPQILGDSAAIRHAADLAHKAAASAATVLLLGESGTGKEVFAHAIHHWSDRRDRPLVIVNCVALPEQLLESELFGHERGAFTGAHQTKKGKFEQADGGTIFLDEIGDMPASLQARLLRVLQEHAFERVGGTKPIRTDIRVIAATNRDLDAAVHAGRFREDLFYRLNVVRITLPPLRDRREDVPVLARHFVARFASETKKPLKGLSPEAEAALVAQMWPGNVRELANVIERAVVLCTGVQIDPEDLLSTTLPIAAVPGSAFHAGDGAGFHTRVRRCKEAILKSALRQAGGNQTKAAELLGLQRTYLVKLLRSFDIQ